MIWLIYAILFLSGVLFYWFAPLKDVLINDIVALLLIISPVILRKILLTRQNTKYKKNILLSNVSTEFEQMYNSLYSTHNLEPDKFVMKIKILDMLLVLVILAVPVIIFLILSQRILLDTVTNIIMCLVVVIILLYAMRWSINSKYKKQYKENIIKNLVKLINGELTFCNDTKSNMKTQFKEANFDLDFYFKCYIDDYIEGYIDRNIEISACDLCAKYENGSHIETIFQGIFAYTKCTKNIGTYIRVSPNKLKLPNSKDNVKLDSEEFEKYFDVYSDNKILTLQLLTSDIMALFIDFHNKYNLDFEVVFKNDTIYTRFFTGAVFEPRLYGKFTDKQLLFTYYSILQFISNVTKQTNKTLENLEI